MEKNKFHVALPVQGAVLAARVRISITAGLVDLNRLIRQDKDIVASRSSALGMFSDLEVRTGSHLIGHFQTSYIP